MERFVATAVGSDNNKPLWHVSGAATDYAAIRLNRIDIASGDQKPIPIWRRPARIEQAWIAVASDRVLVGTAAANPVARTVDVGIDGIDLETRKIVWTKKVALTNATDEELSSPLTAFAQGDVFTCVVGTQHATFSAWSSCHPLLHRLWIRNSHTGS